MPVVNFSCYLFLIIKKQDKAHHHHHHHNNYKKGTSGGLAGDGVVGSGALGWPCLARATTTRPQLGPGSRKPSLVLQICPHVFWGHQVQTPSWEPVSLSHWIEAVSCDRTKSSQLTRSSPAGGWEGIGWGGPHVCSSWTLTMAPPEAGGSWLCPAVPGLGRVSTHRHSCVSSSAPRAPRAVRLQRPPA